MIVGAGVQPDAFDAARPRQFQRAIHQPAPGAGASQSRAHAEHADLTGAGLTKIKFKQTFVGPVAVYHNHSGMPACRRNSEPIARQASLSGGDASSSIIY
jgi:hypothetical protein